MSWESTQWNKGVTLQPLQGGEFQFDFPEKDGHANAIKRAQKVSKNQTITLSFQILTQTGTPKFKSLDPSSGLKPNFRVMIASSELENRWWPAGAQCVFLYDALDKGTLTYSVKLDPKQWQDVNGKINPSGFKAGCKSARIIEIVFGGGRSFSHGITSSGGKAVFQLWNLKIT